MRTRLHATLFGLLLAFVLAASGNAQESTAPPSYFRADENIVITFDPSVLAVSPEAIDELARSKDVAGAAATDLTGEAVELSYATARQRWTSEKLNKSFSAAAVDPRSMGSRNGNQVYFTLRVDIMGSAESTEAKKYARLVVKRLDKALGEMSRREYERNMAQLTKAAEQAKENVELARQKVDQTRAKLSRHGASPLSESVLQELVSDLKKQEQALEVELAGMKGRSEALQREVAKTAESAKREPVDDEVVQNLKRVVKLRMEQLENLKQLSKTGAVSSTEIAKAEEQVALVQVSLAEAKRTTARQASELLEKLNSDLSAISVGMAENEAKLKYVKKRLDEYAAELAQEAEAKPLRQQLERETMTLANVQAQADGALTQVRQLESSYRPARVEVFELAPKDEKPTDAEKPKP